MLRGGDIGLLGLSDGAQEHKSNSEWLNEWPQTAASLLKIDVLASLSSLI